MGAQPYDGWSLAGFIRRSLDFWLAPIGDMVADFYRAVPDFNSSLGGTRPGKKVWRTL